MFIRNDAEETGVNATPSPALSSSNKRPCGLRVNCFIGVMMNQFSVRPRDHKLQMPSLMPGPVLLPFATAISAVGRLPKESQNLIHKAILVQIEEVNHGVMALNDYGKLGGDIAAAKSGHRSPAGLAAAAVIRFLGERVSPFRHIGFMYLFEELTRRLMIGAVPVLRAKGFPEKELEFM